MSESSFTLRNIFALPAHGVLDQLSSQASQIEHDITNQFKDVNWTVAMPRVAPKTDELFDIEIPNVLVAAWKKTAEIQEVLRKSKNSPDDAFYVELAKHTIDSEHHPYVEMRVANSPPKKVVELTVKLSMTIKGFELKIQNGQIRQIRTGQCLASGTIEYKGLVIKKKELGSITLPGTFALRDREAIPERNPAATIAS